MRLNVKRKTNNNMLMVERMHEKGAAANRSTISDGKYLSEFHVLATFLRRIL